MKLKGVAFLLAGLLLGVLLGVAVLVSGTGSASSPNRRVPPTVGSPLRDFDLPLLNGEAQSLSSLAGTPVVLNFWATWCPPCKEEMPLLDRAAGEYSGRLVILGINYGEKPEDVSQYVAESGIRFPILLDKAGLVAEMYYVRNFPTTFFVDAEGILRAQHVGQLTEDNLSKYLQTIGLNE